MVMGMAPSVAKDERFSSDAAMSLMFPVFTDDGAVPVLTVGSQGLGYVGTWPGLCSLMEVTDEMP